MIGRKQWGMMLAVVLAAAASSPARGQYQLGRGHKLDSNLRRGSGGINHPIPPSTAGAVGNAIVTGNVGGLAHFRGIVRYEAAGAFQGQMATDDTYRFRRSSLPSYQRSYSISSFEAAQARFGHVPLGNYAANEILLPPGYGTTVGEVSGQYGAMGARLIGRRDAENLWGMRHTLPTLKRGAGDGRVERFYSAQAGPRRLGVMRNQAGDLVELRASPLTGLVGEAIGLPKRQRDQRRQEGVRMRFGPPEKHAAQENHAQGRSEQANPSNATKTQAKVARRVRSKVTGARIGQPSEKQNDRQDATNISPARTPASKPPTASVRRNRTQTQRQTEPQPSPGIVAGRELFEQILRNIDQQVEPKDASGNHADAASASRPQAVQSGEAVLSTLVPDKDNPLSRWMRRAERAMEQGRYFRALRAYQRALLLRPHYPPAMIGLANAQLGAGFWVPAARTLRSAFTRYPSWVGVRYTQPVLPSTARLREVEAALRERAASSTGSAEVTALLLGYLAYQRKQPYEVRAAMHMLKRGVGEDAALRVLMQQLRNVWLSSPSAREEKPAPARPTTTPKSDDTRSSPPRDTAEKPPRDAHRDP